MVKYSVYFGLILLFLILGCSKDDNTQSPVTIRYELISSSSFQTISNSGGTLPALTLAYINENGQRQQEQLQINGLTWIKTIQITTHQRPIILSFEAAGNTLETSGTVQMKLSVNGELRGSNNVNISSNPNTGYGWFLFGYIGGIAID